ncbi:MAG: flagellar motor stator protein MotA [Proteobacteria bacterium]|nr:flagellar motor stator protein MotA [Pseudomonadota bacterium]
MYYIGIILVIVSVLGGNIIAGGHLSVLWQPAEYIIILGSGIGAFLAGNRKTVMFEILSLMKKSLNGNNKSKKDYTDLLCLMYSIFKLARTKSMIVVEPHIEKPKTSVIFSRYKSFLDDKISCNLFCDYVRMVSMGVDDPIIVEDLMRSEIDALKEESHEYVSSMQTFADSMPALGIVAAVLGVIHTMGSIDQPANVLGQLIGAALVGTFFGILVSYGIVAPIGTRMKQTLEIDNAFFDCIKACIIAYMNNLPPIIAVETARKSIPHEMRPSYGEMEESLNDISESDL